MCLRIAAFLLVPLLAAQTGGWSQKLEAALELKQRGAAAEAAAVFEAVLPEIRVAGDPATLAQALLEAGQAELAAGDYPLARKRGEEAAGLFQSRNDPAGQARRH